MSYILFRGLTGGWINRDAIFNRVIMESTNGVAPVENQKGGGCSLVGSTPILPLRFEPEGITIWGKCEVLNPGGRIMDHTASYMINEAGQRGLLKPDSVILKCSSANVAAPLQAAADHGFEGSIPTARCDRVERYFSTDYSKDMKRFKTYL